MIIQRRFSHIRKRLPDNFVPRALQAGAPTYLYFGDPHCIFVRGNLASLPPVHHFRTALHSMFSLAAGFRF